MTILLSERKPVVRSILTRSLLATLVVACLSWARAAVPNAREEAVRHLFADFKDAFNRHDAHSAATACAEDVDYIVGDGSDIRGRASVEQHLQLMFAGRLRTVRRDASIQEVRFLRPDVAWVVGYYLTVGAIGPTGTPDPPTKGLYDWVVAERDGHWLISLWHESNLPIQSLEHPASAMAAAAQDRAVAAP